MIRIFFRTLWNNRMRNILVFIELFIISLVLLNLTVYLTERIRIRTIKTSYDLRNVVSLALYNKEDLNSMGPLDKIQQDLFANLRLRLLSIEMVESVSFAGNASPFYCCPEGCVHNLGKEEVFINRMNVDLAYEQVMKIKPLKGRWFNETDRGKTIKPVLICKSIEDKYFNGDAVGKMLTDPEPCKLEIIGVVDEFKRTDFEEPQEMGFVYNNEILRSRWLEVLVRTKPGQQNNFLSIAESELFAVLDPKIWVIRSLNSFDNMRSTENLDRLQHKYLGVLLAIFVMINVLLGVIGILWYNTNLRIHEIGVKRALGSTGRSIKTQLILENLILGGLGLIIVALVYIQVPSIRITKVGSSVMYLSVLISVIVMILLILLSTWLPASIASKIRPAEALKTE
ncbi:MAG: FtsX-like permease family protein [Bacteroidales bacterium]